MADRTYTDEQVREIMRRAVQRSSDSGGLGREDLLAAARDVGIAPEAVDAAILELEAEGDLKEELVAMQRERRHELGSSFATWAIVNAGLAGIDAATPGGPWFFWPLGVWGIALLLRLKGQLFGSPERNRREALRRLEQRRRRREREQAEARRRREREQRQSSGGLEGVIERGVEDLLGAAARRIAGVRVEDGAAEAEGDYGQDPDARARGRRRR